MLSRAAFALTSLLSFSLAGEAFALEWKLGPADRAFSGSPSAVARAYVTAFESELALQGVELAERAVLPTHRGTTLRFAQVHRGLPVFDTAIAVRVTAEGKVRRTTLEVARGLDVDPMPVLSEADAAAVVASLEGKSFSGPMQVTLGVFARETKKGTLVYRVDVPSPDGGRRYDLDAGTGRVVHTLRLGKTLTGRVYRISSAVTPDPTDEVLLDLDGAKDRLSAFDGGLAAYEYVSGAPGMNFVVAQETAPNDGDNFTYDPPATASDETDPFAVVNTFYHVHRMRTFFEKTLGVDMSADSWSLAAVANVLNADGSPMDNAAFAPTPITAVGKKNTIIIGQGQDVDFASDSDVFLHEFTHYVAHNAIGYSQGQLDSDEYGLNTFSGSIDEGTADYFACSVNKDPVLGEATLEPLGAERDLSKNEKTCPEGLFGEVHEDGKIVGSLAWAVRDALGSDRGDQVVWGALSMLTKGTSLGDFAGAIVAGTEDMQKSGDVTNAELDKVKKAVADRGLEDCGRVLSLDEGKVRTTTLVGFDLVGRAFGANCAVVQGLGSLNSLFHFSKKPGPGATGIKFSTTLVPDGAGVLKWGLYVRAGEHVGFKPALGFSLPSVETFSHSAEGFTETTGEIVIDENSDPPFDPAQTYYAVIVQANCPTSEATITAEDIGGGAGGGGGGGTGEPKAADAGDDGGCGCRVAGTSSSDGMAWIGFAAIGAFGIRRRRR